MVFKYIYVEFRTFLGCFIKLTYKLVFTVSIVQISPLKNNI